jgi:hypothetical protein
VISIIQAVTAQWHLISPKPANVTGMIATAQATAFCFRDKLNEAIVGCFIRQLNAKAFF